MKLEVCCSSRADVENALAGGADRIELCQALATGGLTPSASMIKDTVEVAHNAGVNVHVLIRPREGDFAYSDDELNIMTEDIALCRTLGADGVVIGALTPEQKIDTAMCRKMILAARGMRVTFSRAFDLCPDKKEAAATLIQEGCDYILSSGGEPTASEGAETLRELVDFVDGKITMIAASGINADNFAAIVRKTCVKEIHGSFRRPVNPALNAPSLPGLESARKITSAPDVGFISKAIKAFVLALMIVISSKASAFTRDEIMSIMMQTASVPDIVNTYSSIYEEAAEATWNAINEMPWGKTIPERELRFFVIPLRVNNEPIDGHRPVMYDELRERVRCLSMEDAILEVNHWCHEYVTYQPSDARTHTPLQSMSSCVGRCGEESTFTVAALRAVGIPARQVYTPRWAHTDDNHAWVEAWAEGKWHFIGACEPEPVLDLAWFNAPATRGMMMHTFVRGDYDGPEEIVERVDDGVSINVTSNYAPVTETRVMITDDAGNPVQGAKVSFRVYNYAEFYPLTTKISDISGKASVLTGLGDMLVWAVSADGDRFGFAKVSAGRDGDMQIPLRYNIGLRNISSFSFDIIPPPQGSNIVTPSAGAKAVNDARMAHEDSIRLSRIAEFMTRAESDALAKTVSVDPERLWNLTKHARGNASTLSSFLGGTEPAQVEKAVSLLETLSVKDLSDVTLDVLQDHITAKDSDSPCYKDYILCPRIDIEDLSSWRRPLSQRLPAFKTVEELAEWVDSEIEIIPDWTPAMVSIHPEKVIETRTANARSRDIFFVAAARTLGFPARIDPVTKDVQWWKSQAGGGEWINLHQEKNAAESAGTPKGFLQLTLPAANRTSDPAYYHQFSLCKLVNGEPRQLEYDETAKYSDTFADSVQLEVGDYMLVSGQRLANGGVLSKIVLFGVRQGETTSVELEIRHDDSAVEVIGSLNAEDLYIPLNDAGGKGERKSILSTTGRGFYILGIVNLNHEPSNHVINDIAAVKKELENSGIPMLMLLTDGSDSVRFMNSPNVSELPSRTCFGIDSDDAIAKELINNLKLPTSGKPIFVIADTFNRVVFLSQGYTIGLGRTLVETLEKI